MKFFLAHASSTKMLRKMLKKNLVSKICSQEYLLRSIVTTTQTKYKINLSFSVILLKNILNRGTCWHNKAFKLTKVLEKRLAVRFWRFICRKIAEKMSDDNWSLLSFRAESFINHAQNSGGLKSLMRKILNCTLAAMVKLRKICSNF